MNPVMRSYKIVVSYDGTDYFGWQEQLGYPTIAGALQDSFFRLFDEEIKVVGSSRTDTGVHALGQVARFYTSRMMDADSMLRSWNSALPKDIHIRSLEPILDNFHPQHNVASKTYYYHFFMRRPLPMMARYGYYFYHPLNLEKLRTCLQLFVGTHDFASFCFKAFRHQDTVCTIEYVHLEYIQQYRMYRIIIRGNRFLHNMIRRMVGAAIKLASYDTSLDIIKEALAQPRKDYALQTAPAHGLVLRKIVYNADHKKDIHKKCR